MVTAEQAKIAMAKATQLFSEEEVEVAIDQMAVRINKILADKDPIFLCVMTGGLIPTAGLLMRLDFPLQLDYVHASRYGSGTRGKELNWVAEPRVELKGRVVLVVDDILDEGLTLEAIIKYCEQKGAQAVYSAVLLDKVHNRKNGLTATFTALTVGDRYVFGYGMDYSGYLRNAPGIFALKEEHA